MVTVVETKHPVVLLAVVFILVGVIVGVKGGILPEVEKREADDVKQPWESTRLPETLRPISYDLKVRTDLTNSIFTGSVSVLVECLQDTNVILIHSKELVIGEGKTTLTRQGSGTKAPELAKDPWLYTDNQFAVIELNGELDKGAQYRLYMEFQGPLKNDLLGYYKMSYKTASGEEKYLTSTFFDPVDARKAFPCFDEPDLKATFTINLEHEPEYHALSNMPKRRPDEQLEVGWIRATFEETVVMPTYLVCYVISEFKAKFKNTTNGVKFGIWAREDFIDQVDYALDKGAAMLDYFDALFGDENKYPLPKMDMIALPEFMIGAMENWGLNTYKERELLYKEGETSEKQKYRICTLIAHELAHQWFGNLVTTKWWDSVWLNEGFASYVEYEGAEFAEPEWEVFDKFILYDLHPSMAMDAQVTSRPMVTDVLTPSENIMMFDKITYLKGACILRMMKYFLEEPNFRKGLQYYLKALQYGNAENSDVWVYMDKALQEDSVDLGEGLDVATIMATWTLQMGFPFITVERSYNGAHEVTARVEQKRFLSDPNSNMSTDYPDVGYKWYVPLTYTSASSADFDSPRSMWLQPQDEFVTLQIPGGSDDEWLLVNVEKRGYYRVNYDDRNWELLKVQLDTEHTVIPTASRASLIGDVFSLATAGEINHRTALDMTSYLKAERDYVPWYAADHALGMIKRNIRRRGVSANFKKYMRGQVSLLYEYIGWNNEGDHLNRMSRGLAVSMACRYGNVDCRHTAVNLYAELMENGDQTLISPDMLGTVFCTAIAAGGSDEWYFAFHLYQNPNTSTSVKQALLTAMACTSKSWILRQYLDSILNSSIIRMQDGPTVLKAVAGNPFGLPLAWDFFRANWDFIRAAYGDIVFVLDSLIGSLLSNFNTEFELQMVKQFIADHPDQGSGARPFAEAVAVIEANIRWINLYYKDVADWLKEAVKEPWEKSRLPDTILPISYDVKVRTDLTNFVFNGSVDVLIECLKRTYIILLHSGGLTIPDNTATLTQQDGGQAPRFKSPPWRYYYNDYLVMELDSLLEAGTKYWLHLDFTSFLIDGYIGYYLSSYVLKSGETRYMASTTFAPSGAREAFPCFDEPDMKATFTITMEHQPQYHALANMPKSRPDEEIEGGWRKATFEKSVVMSTYLVCYAVSDFKAKFMTTQNGVELGVWAQGDLINQTDYALQKGVEILDYFDDLFGMDVKYPIAKLDMIALPEMLYQAMENWGLITYAKTNLLYEEGVSSERRKERVCTFIAHELAHQWFGNLVTAKWWDYTWLNEGVARWLEYVGAAYAEPDWELWDKFVVSEVHKAMETDALPTSRPIVIKRARYGIGDAFPFLIYTKGSSLMRMANNFVGQDTFFRGLKSYLRALQYGNAENSDMWYHVNKATKEDGVDLGDGITDIATVMDSWTNQMGFPVVMITRTYSGQANKITASATQKRYLADQLADTTSPYPDLGYVWHIPLTLTGGANPNLANPELRWMRPEDQTTEVVLHGAGGDSNWFLVNVNQTGFYRVNYDETNWALLSAQLQADHTVIPISSRSALLYDAFSLARVGDLSQTKALDLTSYLDVEKDYVPWVAFKGVVEYVSDNLALEDANEKFTEYVRSKVSPMYEYVGWEDGGDDDDHHKRLARVQIIDMACKYGNEHCVSRAARMYADWMTTDKTTTTIASNLQETVFCTAIAAGGQKEWDAAYSAYNDPNIDSSLRDILVVAMGCSQNREILETYLRTVLNFTLMQSRDGQYVISAIAGNPVGRTMAWKLVATEWNFFKTMYGLEVVNMVTSDLNTEAQLEKVKKFQADHSEEGRDVYDAFAKAITVIRANVRWMDGNYNDVANWLKKVVY
ncbi:putative aminopeptidase-2 [Patiria miniata]|uniref:Aminopeptidase N n=1 Tax=Patiria miniata TaxID=46514 RepID=A0A914A8E6_PATMI|nr:putative aminopeptidase-2 [Patiria miniata]